MHPEVERVRGGGIREWEGGLLVRATCRDCKEITPADELVNSRHKKGGKMLLCLGCSRLRGRKHYEQNASCVKDKSRANYWADVDKSRARSRSYMERNKDKRNAYDSQYREINRERRREQQRTYRVENYEQEAIRLSRYRLSPRGRAIKAAQTHTRRTRETELDHGCVTAEALMEIWNASSGLCVYCGSGGEHFDHVSPLSKGGLHCAENLVLACAPCNLRKGAKSVYEFIEYMRGTVKPPRLDPIRCNEGVTRVPLGHMAFSMSNGNTFFPTNYTG
jgi:5-methylcytosine-specific restriction endonuclease McrA